MGGCHPEYGYQPIPAELVHFSTKTVNFPFQDAEDVIHQSEPSFSAQSFQQAGRPG